MKKRIHTFLRWSERYTKTDMVYVARGGFWITAGNVVSALAAFGLAIAYANLLPKESYGIYKYILSLAGIIGAFSLTGLAPALVTAIAKGFDGSLRHAFKTGLRWGTAIFTISVLGAIYYLINENYTLAMSLAIVGVTLPIIHSAGLSGAFFNGKKNFKTAAIAGIIITIVVAVAVIVTAMFTHGPTVLILAYFLSTAAVSLSIYLWTLRTYKPYGPVDKNFILFGKHLSLTNVLETISEHLDKVLVFHYLGAAQLAVYTFALAIPNQMNAVAKGIKSITLPKLSEKDIGALREGIKAKTLRLFFIFLSITITYIISAPYIYRLLFPQYMESVLYSQILSVTLLASSTMLIAQIFVAHGKTREIYINKISSDALKIILLLALLPFFGIWGAVFVVLFNRSFSIVMMYILYKRM